MSNSFDYAVVRIVPLPHREEFFNAGIILFCPQKRFLVARVHLQMTKLTAMSRELTRADIEARLAAIVKICEGVPAGGTIASLSQRARFHWLVAPRSAVIQISPVHCGICDDPAAVLDRLFDEQVTS